jgi:hypothetical protein
VLCHGEFFFEENVDTLVKAIRAAFYKRGVPEQLLVDNGSIYGSHEITLICARVGSLLRHTPVRDAAAKGKIERFFRRVRDPFLIQQLDLSSLESLNRPFTHGVEHEYNAADHDALGRKPIDRFGIDRSRVRFLAPSEHRDERFFAEATRKVKKDNPFSFAGRRYESMVDFRDREIERRYARRRSETSAVLLYHAGRCRTTILDDAHLMDLANRRTLRQLFEDFPKNHNLILIGRPGLLADLDLGVNQDIQSRVTDSVVTKRLGPDPLRDFLHRELDRVGLGHHTFTPPAIDLVVRSAEGVLRKARNLSVGCLIEAVRSARKTIDLDIVNRVRMQPHWQTDTDLVDY